MAKTKPFVVDKSEVLALVDNELSKLGPGDERIIAHIYGLRKGLQALQGPKGEGRPREPKKTRYERKETYTPDEVFPHIQDDHRETHRKNHLFDGDPVHMDSLRYKVFRRSRVCVECGLEGTVFAKERGVRRDGKPIGERFHLNLYGFRPDGTEVILTKDHILPRSKGGSDSLSNLQTMCGPCNWKKGNKA